jgi:hypothetical protein
MKIRHISVQNPIQNIRRNLATTARAVAEFSQLDRQSVILLWVEATWLSSQYATVYNAAYSPANKTTGVRPLKFYPPKRIILAIGV